MRYAGQGHEILVDLPDSPFTAATVAELRKRFEAGYRTLFSRVVPGVDVEVTGWILRAETPAPGRAADLPKAAGAKTKPVAAGRRTLYDPILREFSDVPVYSRSTLSPGSEVPGPAIIAEDETTTIVTSGFTAALDPSGAIRLTSKSVAATKSMGEAAQ